MRPTGQRVGPLTPFRALDLTSDMGFLCGRILADLGCEVIKVEPPGGDSARLAGPFLGEKPDPQASLYWFAYNANKKSITLDLHAKRGKELFKSLVSKANFVIESSAPAEMKRLGLGYATLSQLNPRLIVTSITPFGQTGPYRDFKGSDIVCLAMSGLMYVVGDPDRQPVRLTADQAYLYAGAEAASASVVAHYRREATGEGQHIDVSVQEAIAWTLGNESRSYEITKTIAKRRGRAVQGGKVTRSYIFPCKDGYVAFLIQPGVIGAKTMAALVGWMHQYGMAGGLERTNWDAVDLFTITQAEVDGMEATFTAFFQTKSKADLFNEGMRRRFLVYPVNSPSEVLANPQLRARDFFVDVRHDDLRRTIAYPGAWYGSTETPWLMRRRAPRPGEDNADVYGRLLDLRRNDLESLTGEGIV